MISKIRTAAATVKALHSRPQHAYRTEDVRLGRRLTGLLDLLGHPVPVSVLGERWGLRPSCLLGFYQFE